MLVIYVLLTTLGHENCDNELDYGSKWNHNGLLELHTV